MGTRRRSGIAPAQFFPKRWYMCREFCADLYQRRYAEPDLEALDGVRRVLPDGMYWYLYELWQDGRMSERAAVLTGALEATVISARPARDDRRRGVSDAPVRDDDEEEGA